jgi:hypothetical protein
MARDDMYIVGIKVSKFWNQRYPKGSDGPENYVDEKYEIYTYNIYYDGLDTEKEHPITRYHVLEVRTKNGSFYFRGQNVDANRTFVRGEQKFGDMTHKIKDPDNVKFKWNPVLAMCVFDNESAIEYISNDFFTIDRYGIYIDGLKSRDPRNLEDRTPNFGYVTINWDRFDKVKEPVLDTYIYVGKNVAGYMNEFPLPRDYFKDKLVTKIDTVPIPEKIETDVVILIDETLLPLVQERVVGNIIMVRLC